MQVRTLIEAPGTVEELVLDKAYLLLIAYTFETIQETKRREFALVKLEAMFKGWVRKHVVKIVSPRYIDVVSPKY